MATFTNVEKNVGTDTTWAQMTAQWQNETRTWQMLVGTAWENVAKAADAVFTNVAKAADAVFTNVAKSASPTWTKVSKSATPTWANVTKSP